MTIAKHKMSANYSIFFPMFPFDPLKTSENLSYPLIRTRTVSTF